MLSIWLNFKLLLIPIQISAFLHRFQKVCNFLRIRHLLHKLNHYIKNILVLSSFYEELLVMSSLIKLRVKDEKVSLSFLIIASLILYPGVNYSLKFLIPVGLGLIRIFKYDKSYNYLYLLFLQGALFNSINILMLFCYRYFVYILGLCFVLSFFSLFFNIDGIYIF